MDEHLRALERRLRSATATEQEQAEYFWNLCRRFGELDRQTAWLLGRHYNIEEAQTEHDRNAHQVADAFESQRLGDENIYLAASCGDPASQEYFSSRVKLDPSPWPNDPEEAIDELKYWGTEPLIACLRAINRYLLRFHKNCIPPQFRVGVEQHCEFASLLLRNPRPGAMPAKPWEAGDAGGAFGEAPFGAAPFGGGTGENPIPIDRDQTNAAHAATFIVPAVQASLAGYTRAPRVARLAASAWEVACEHGADPYHMGRFVRLDLIPGALGVQSEQFGNVMYDGSDFEPAAQALSSAQQFHVQPHVPHSSQESSPGQGPPE